MPREGLSSDSPLGETRAGFLFPSSDDPPPIAATVQLDNSPRQRVGRAFQAAWSSEPIGDYVCRILGGCITVS